VRGVSAECLADCCPHDSSSQGTGCPGDIPDAPLPERVSHLRNCRLLPVNKIAAVTGVDREFVTRLLYEAIADVTVRRGARRTGTAEWLDQVMADLPQEHQVPATRVAPSSSRSSARGPSEIELLSALYADSEVSGVLDRHGIPLATLAAPTWKRFPAPQPLTAALVSDLYEGCGLSLHHIELLTGRPAAAVGAVLRTSGVKRRPAGGRSPFMERYRLGKT
jgi:alkylated DNA nucleotide flippase Atl1